MKQPVWVLADAVVVLHEQLLGGFGGSGGLRDAGLLTSALARPANLFASGKPSRFDLAASYAFGLVRDHPFVDGNKRIGFVVAALFLELNGYTLVATEVDATVKMLALATGEIGEREFAAWLEANSARNP